MKLYQKVAYICGLVSVGALAGCGGGEDPVDANPGGRDVGLVDARALGDAGAPVDAPAVASAISMVPRTDTSHSDWAPVRVVAFNIVQNRETNFEEAFAVIENTSATETFCTVSADFVLKSATGTTLYTARVLFDSSPRILFGAASDCLAPGAQALGYGNRSALTPLDRVTVIDFSFRGIGGPTMVFATVANEGVTVVDPYDGGLYYALRGTLRVVSGNLRNPRATFLALDASGLPIAQISKTEIGTFSAGNTLPFTTTATRLPFTRYLSAHSFREATSPIVQDSPEAQRAHELAVERQQLQAEIDARRDAAR